MNAPLSSARNPCYLLVNHEGQQMIAKDSILRRTIDRLIVGRMDMQSMPTGVELPRGIEPPWLYYLVFRDGNAMRIGQTIESLAPASPDDITPIANDLVDFSGIRISGAEIINIFADSLSGDLYYLLNNDAMVFFRSDRDQTVLCARNLHHGISGLGYCMVDIWDRREPEWNRWTNR